MDTECRIKWLDDETEMDVTIRATEFSNDLDDNNIFFYGMNREECIHAMETGKHCENEWQIIKVY